MTTVSKILHCVAEADIARKEVMELVEEFIKDKKIPLDDRWEVFTKTPAHLFEVDDYYWCDEDLDLEHVFLEPYFYIEALYYYHGETVDNVEFVTRIKDRGYLEDGEETLLKEAILQSGIREWKVCW